MKRRLPGWLLISLLFVGGIGLIAILKSTKPKRANTRLLYSSDSRVNNLSETVTVFEISLTNPLTHADYGTYLKCELGQEVRPTSSSRITFLLLKANAGEEECEFRVLFDGDPGKYEGTVQKGEFLTFSPKVARLHVSLVDIGVSNATLMIPGLASPSK